MDRSKNLTKTNYPAEYSKESKFNVIRTTIGCEFKRWALLRFPSGKLGWALNSELKKNSLRKKIKKINQKPQACALKQFYACLLYTSDAADE